MVQIMISKWRRAALQAMPTAFDEESQSGFGEYTFKYKDYQAHGIVADQSSGTAVRDEVRLMVHLARQRNFRRNARATIYYRRSARLAD